MAPVGGLNGKCPHSRVKCCVIPIPLLQLLEYKCWGKTVPRIYWCILSPQNGTQLIVGIRKHV